jgi:hypothetical protein
MARFDDADYVDPREREAAVAIKDAAERLQAILYYLSTEDIDLPSETRTVLLNCYRPLHRADKHYFNEDSLVFEPPASGTPFRSRDRK